MAEAVECLLSITRMPIDLYALDIIPQADQYFIYIRMGGIPETLLSRIDRIRMIVGDGEVIEGEEEIWNDITNFTWLQSGELLVKIPITPKSVGELDIYLAGSSAKRHYSVGCNVAWVAWCNHVDDLDMLLKRLGLSGLVLVGQVDKIHLGLEKGNKFSKLVKEALDPGDKWVEV